MATTKARIIKLGNGSTTYIPITSTNASQHYDGSSYVVLESYLGGLSNRIQTNTDNISTLAGAALQAKANLNDLNAQVANYNATYIKAGTTANKISYNLPNGTYGLITVNDVAHATNADNATTATNLANAPVINKTDASGNNADNFTVTAGEKTSTSVSLSKATSTTYGVVKLGDLALAEHTHTSELFVNTADATITYNTGGEGAKTTQAYKGGTAYGFVKVDSSVSDTSENPVQNKVIKKYADDTFLTKTEFESFSASGMHYKGNTATVPSNPTSGDVYHVTTKITSGLGDNVTAEVGDFITYYKPEGGTGSWSVWDKNVDKAIYAGNNTLTTGQMLVTDGTDGKVKSQAIPTVSVSGGGTGNVVKTISNEDHSISYTVGYAVDTLEKASGSYNSGVLTNITRTNNKLTVTYTDLTTNDPTSGAATNAVSVTYIATVSQGANGKISATKGTVNIKTMSGATSSADGAVGLVPQPKKADVTTVVKVLGADGNWKTVSTPSLSHNVSGMKVAESNKTVDIDESLFGTFGTAQYVVSVDDHASTTAVIA